MSLSWARSRPEDLRGEYASEASALIRAMPRGVVATVLPEECGFRGGILFSPPRHVRDRTIVYFHGGGFVAGAPETHRGLTAWLASLSGLPVLSARYRLAPEHPFPAQRDDAVAAVETALRRGATEVILAGDSAGAGVALWGLRALPRRSRDRVRGLVLIYGGFGLLASGSIACLGTAENGLDAETLAVMYGRLAIGPPEHAAWPINFAAEIVEPAYVLAAGRDPLLDDSDRLYRTMDPAHPASRFVVAEGREHGFMKAAGSDPAATRELRAIADWVGTLSAST